MNYKTFSIYSKYKNYNLSPHICIYSPHITYKHTQSLSFHTQTNTKKKTKDKTHPHYKISKFQIILTKKKKKNIKPNNNKNSHDNKPNNTNISTIFFTFYKSLAYTNPTFTSTHPITYKHTQSLSDRKSVV